MDKSTLARFVFDAAEETFATMLGLEVAHGESYIESPEAVVASDRVVALVGIAGHFNGTGIIDCSPGLACRLSSQMLMADFQGV